MFHGAAILRGLEERVDADMRALAREPGLTDFERARLRRERWRRGEDVGFEVGDRVRVGAHYTNEAWDEVAVVWSSRHPELVNRWDGPDRLLARGARSDRLCSHHGAVEFYGPVWTLLEPHA
jgi:hypothetical protein